MASYLSAAEIRAISPDNPAQADSSTAVARARERMQAHGQWHANQALGRRYGVGCVALEVTQRCNLDCTLCYLSESSEALKDIPLVEVFRRIDMILAHYGPNTDVQVTGGDPTLRDPAELTAIIARIHARGMRSSLFTNGIKASRDLLERLAAAGLTDVAFHVDMTQERAGYADETALNAVRLEYIERARGLALHVVFNTTVFDGNLAQVPDLVRFFVSQAEVVQFVSFQLQAATGRGVLGTREVQDAQVVNPDTIARLIAQGAAGPVSFGSIQAGHRDCNRYAATFVVNRRLHDVFADQALAGRWLESMQAVRFERNQRWRAVRAVLGWWLANPRELWGGAQWFARTVGQLRHDLLAARGRVYKLSFFIHNFMDACSLEHDRIGTCSFMVATGEGPISMCLHNARRDDFLLQATPVAEGTRIRFWNPVTGSLQDEKPERLAVALTRKNARGRSRTSLAAAPGGRTVSGSRRARADQENG